MKKTMTPDDLGYKKYVISSFFLVFAATGAGAYISFWESAKAQVTAPAISAVTGTFSQGGVVTITGTNFGNKPNGAKPLYYWDFENNATPNPTLSRTMTNPAGTMYGSRSTNLLPSGSTGAFRHDLANSAEAAFLGIPFQSDDLYVWYKSNHDFNYSTSPEFNLKQTRLWHEWTHDVYYGTNGNQSGNNPGDGNPRYVVEQVSQGGGSSGATWGGLPFQGNAWFVNEWQYRTSSLNTLDGIYQHIRQGRYSLNPATRHVTRDTAHPEKFSALYFDQKSNSSGLANAYVYYDAIYVDDSWARVMVSTEPAWQTATYPAGTSYIREIQIPTSWSNSAITASVSQGSYSEGQTVYLYVVDVSGNVNQNGYPVVIGGSSSSVPPAPVADTASPSVPAGLSATPVSTSQINLSWTASTDDTAVAGYTIYRDATLLATTTNTVYGSTGLTPSTAYAYAISAYDAAGNSSAQSGNVSATTQSAAVIPPPTPSVPSPSQSSASTGGGGGEGVPSISSPAIPQLPDIPKAVATTTVTALGVPSASAPLSRALVLGMSGEDVQTLQQILKNEGLFAGTSAGYFDVSTQAALQAFQSRESIVSSGSPQTTGYGSTGPLTRAKLNSKLKISTPAASSAGIVITKTLSVGSRGNDVTLLQQHLILRGYLFGASATGYFGKLTEAAVKAFQKANNLETVGWTGPKTREALSK